MRAVRARMRAILAGCLSVQRFTVTITKLKEGVTWGD